MRIKKRLLLTFIIAIFCCLIFSKAWYIKDGLPVQFNMTALGKYDVWIVFNKKNNDSFRKIKSDFKKVNFDGDYEISLSPKIVKIHFYSPKCSGIKYTNKQYQT